MPSKTMLIDASHPEETRVVVIDGPRVEDYDVEVASRRQLKGNIYLAKVTRVEPSLQAAFVDYGGNRHGFLAFNEIHPDYYQIPVADRERLLAEQAAESVERDEVDEAEGEAVGEDEEEAERRRPRPPSRFYKIQEVIKRRQIMLVQVTKEERGNKGAALTTYLSLAGRYCVLMPNTARGGGISRKIATATDRKRLKKMLSELEVPEGMAVIVRTAGAGRSKAEIKRDYEYLVRLWSSIRETTLHSTAPTLVYEEASLIKRSIRDLYDRDIEEIVVQGAEEYRVAKEFMKLFISSHAKRVKEYEDAETPLFHKYAVEDQLASMHQAIVQLRSGGYIVINPTEALVAIDVNSGRSTRERNIEETALRTNLEAADEVARQLRLRDLAGLIVIDFIDMENTRNQGLVERRMKEAMKNDRARVQLGRISPFGLLELSRQRLRPSLVETSFEVCPACGGNGLRRTTESSALALLRKLEEEGLRRRSSAVAVTVSPAIALYLLNQKRRSLQTIEDRYGMAVSVLEDAGLVPPDYRLERLKAYDAHADEETVEAEEAPAEAEAREVAETAAGEREDAAGRGRRRRPRRRRRSEEEAPQVEEMLLEHEPEAAGEEEEAEAEGEDADSELPVEVTAGEAGDQSGRKRRRRGKRGGRRRARPLVEADADEFEPGEAVVLEETGASAAADDDEAAAASDEAVPAEAFADSDREAGPEFSPETAGEASEATTDSSDAEAAENSSIEAGEAKPRPRRRSRRPQPEIAAEAEVVETLAEAEIAGEADAADDGWAPAAEDEAEVVAEAEAADQATVTGEAPAFPEAEPAVEAPLPAAAIAVPEEEAAGEETPTMAEAAELSAGELRAISDEVPEPMEHALVMEVEPRSLSPWSLVGDGTAPLPASEGLAEAETVPAAASAYVSRATADEEPERALREEESQRAEEARRTEIIRVGEGGDLADETRRRGWWQRLVT